MTSARGRLPGLTQPDHRTCGPSAIVAARLLVDPGYAPASFATEVLSLHRRLTSARFAGRPQAPWPRALGTPPWAVARAMSGLGGLHHRLRVVRLGDRSRAFDALLAAVGAGHPVPVYVGSAWLPRHVVLAVAQCPGGVEIYDPARGRLGEMSRSRFLAGRLQGRWTTPWFVVQPIDV